MMTSHRAEENHLLFLGHFEKSASDTESKMRETIIDYYFDSISDIYGGHDR